MPATLLSQFGTTYQRFILQEIHNTTSDWVNGPSPSTLIRQDSSFTSPFRIIFHGEGLFFNGSSFGGSVDRIEIFHVNFVPGQPLTTTKLADISGLNIASIADFIANAATLTVGEPDFSDPATIAYFGDVTPGKTVGTDGDDFIEVIGNIVAGKGDDVALVGPPPTGAGSVSIKMGAGNDAVDFRNLTGPIAADLAAGFVAFGTHVWTISGVDVLFGTDFRDTLDGSADDDVIFGRGEIDVIHGFGGKDKLHGDEGDDAIFGGNRSDRLFGDEDDDELFGENGDDFLFGGSGLDELFGGKGNDTLSGNFDTDVLRGGDGRDELFGGNGADFLHGGDKKDMLFGGSHSDMLFGNNGNDTLRGGNGQDFLRGNDGNDKLFGEQGIDQLFGGKGNDTITGGTERDSFQFHGVNLGDDRITDFEGGVEKIEISGQTSADVTIVAQGNMDYLVTHAQGTILVHDINDVFSMSDIVLT